MAFGFDKLAGLNPFAGGGLVSIDFGSQLLKVLQVTPGEPAQLVAAACVQTPPELMHDAAKRLEFQCEQLPTVIKAGGFKGRRGVCSLPVSQMFCKHMQVAVEAGGSVTEAAAAMAAGQLGVEPDVLAVRAIEVSDAVVPGGSAGNGGGPKREVIALATAKSLVDRVMEALRTAKLEPVGLQSEFQAIVAGFRPVNRRTQDIDVTSLYLDIGAGATKIVIGHGTKLAFAKAIGIGGRFIDQVAAHQAGCSVAEARTLRLGMQTLQRGGAGGAVVETEGGGGAATMVAQSAKASVIDLAEPLRALTDEINLSVRYHQELFPKRQIDRLIFVGGESRHAALCQHIARQFSFPAHTSDPLARIARTGSEPCNGVDIAQPQPGWAVPLGLLLAPTDV